MISRIAIVEVKLTRTWRGDKHRCILECGCESWVAHRPFETVDHYCYQCCPPFGLYFSGGEVLEVESLEAIMRVVTFEDKHIKLMRRT